MKFSYGLLVLFFFLSCISYSQKDQIYTPLKCAGEIPPEFRTLTATKVQKAQAKERQSSHTYKEKRQINDFLLRNNYVIDELLNSGKVLFGDSVSLYLKSLADLLLANNPELNAQLRFYAIKSNDVNAFTTSQGIIFVTLGLLAQVENEAQLAFVLAHEIAHFEKEHGIASVLENSKIYNTTRNDRYNGYESRIRLLSTFSKDLELQADSIGFNRFVQSGYNMKAALTMMDVLQLAFMPFEDVDFDPSFLELDSMQIPNFFILDSLSEIPIDSDDFDDSKSTHPNIRKRREILENMVANLGESSGKYYLLGKEKFESIQRMSRNEIIHLDLVEQQYIDALYNSYVLLRRSPENQYLRESIAKSLYGISKYSNSNDLSDIGIGSTDSYSNIQRCYYLFETLSDEQINIIAIRYLYEVFNAYHSPFIEQLLNDLIKEG